MTRKSKVQLAAAGAVFALVAVTTFWLTGYGETPADDTPSPAHATPPSATPEPRPGPIDPQAIAEVREAYRKSLAENAPPRMLELMQGHDQPAAGLPPPADPFVTPARFNPGTAVGDLPPLPPELASPPAKSPAPAKEKEGPAKDLPPLPPVSSPR